MTSAERLLFAGVLSALFVLSAAANAGCNCAGASYPRPAIDWVNRQETAGSTYKIAADVTLRHQKTSEDDVPQIEHQRWSGTGWVAASASDRAYVMTAGHVCETRKQIEVDPDPLEQLLLGAKPEIEDVIKVEYTLIAADGTEYGGAIAIQDDDDVDICVLSVGANLGRALPIADADPDYGSRGWYVGAPKGIWGNGLAGVFEVTYAGRAALFRGECDDDEHMKKLCDADGEVFTGDFAPGASGSPILIDGRVVGVMNLSPPSFPSIGSAVPWDVARRVLARALHE